MVKKVLDIIQEIGEDALEHYDSRIRSAIPLRLSEAETATATAFYESVSFEFFITALFSFLRTFI